MGQKLGIIWVYISLINPSAAFIIAICKKVRLISENTRPSISRQLLQQFTFLFFRGILNFFDWNSGINFDIGLLSLSQFGLII
jgi:hypothetical protein